jgi:hypothetical protein
MLTASCEQRKEDSRAYEVETEVNYSANSAEQCRAMEALIMVRG